VLAAIFAEEVTARLDDGIVLGNEVPVEARPDPSDRLTPIPPALDLAANDLFMRRPDARPAKVQPDPSYVEIGARLMPIIVETQKVTLAGFRVLDPHGVVIAGRDEVGQSLAHIDEVAAALHGQYRAALRIRVPDKAPPPIYSISRGVGVHVFSAMPVIVNDRVAGVIYTSRTPRNIFDHLYQAGEIRPRSDCRRARDDRDWTDLFPHHHATNVRADRPRRQDRPRGSRRLQAAQALWHARIRASVAQLPRHGRAACTTLGLHRELFGSSHP
jgi:hypothetical protein